MDLSLWSEVIWTISFGDALVISLNDILEAPPHSTEPKSPDKRPNWEASTWTYQQARKYSKMAMHDCPRLKQTLELTPWVLKRRSKKGSKESKKGTQGPQRDPKVHQKGTQRAPIGHRRRPKRHSRDLNEATWAPLRAPKGTQMDP